MSFATSRWFFRWLLLLYPASYRRRYGSEMIQVFVASLEYHRGRRGRWGVVYAWWRGALDTVTHAGTERARTLRAAWSGWPFGGSIVRDVQYAVRALARRPGSTMLAVFSLAVGIGVNTTVFTTVNSMFWRPLAVHAPQEIVRVLAFDRRLGRPSGFSYPDFRTLQENAPGLSGVLVHRMEELAVGTSSGTEVVYGEAVSANYFQVLGVNAAMGRVFSSTDMEETPHGAVVVLSHDLWQRTFGGDPGILGKSISINGHELVVLGIAPTDFIGTKFELALDAWIPLEAWMRLEGRERDRTGRGVRNVGVVARLAPGYDITRVEPVLVGLGERLAATYPETNAGTTFRVVPERQGGLELESPTLLTMIQVLAFGASALVLIVACINVANMLLARGVARRREIGLRMALGASRGRLVRQLLSETVVLATLAGAAGIALARSAGAVLIHFMPPIPYRTAFDLTPDRAALVFGLGLAMVATLACGLFPAVFASRPDVVSLVSGDIGSASRQRDGSRFLHGLVTGQVTLALLSLLLAGLFLRSLQNVRTMDPGFALRQGALVTLNPSLTGYDAERGRALFNGIEARVRQLPGVESAALTYMVPLSDSWSTTNVFAGGRTYAAHDRGTAVRHEVVTPGYFQTMGVPVLRGRAFDTADDADARPVAVVNQRLVDLLWSGEDVVGREIRYSLDNRESAMQIVGVVPTGRYGFIAESSVPAIFRPHAQSYQPSMTLVVATDEPRTVLPVVRHAIEGLDPTLAVLDAKTVVQHTTGAMWMFRVSAALTIALASMAVLLAGAGLYGIAAFSVAQRMREFGIRVAMGAAPDNLLGLVFARGLAMAGVGSGLGIALALPLAGPLESVLVDVQPRDPWVMGLVVAGIFVVTLAASLQPALRVARADPVQSLRAE